MRKLPKLWLSVLALSVLVLPSGLAATKQPPRYLPPKSFKLVAKELEEVEGARSVVAYTQALGDTARTKGVTVEAAKNGAKYGAQVVEQNPTKRKVHGKSVGLVENSGSFDLGWVEKGIYMTVQARGLTEAETFAVADAVKVTGKADAPFEMPKVPTGLVSAYAGPKLGLIKSTYRVTFEPSPNPKKQASYLTVQTVDPNYLGVWLTEFLGTKEITVRGKKAYQFGESGIVWMEKPDVFVVARSTDEASTKAFAESIAPVSDPVWAEAMKSIRA
jgi:hypothetical protein